MWVTLRNKLKVGSREKVRVPKVLLPEKDLLTDGVLRSPGMTAALLKGKRCLVAHLVSCFFLILMFTAVLSAESSPPVLPGG